jgi:hypothetical protein
MILANNNLPVPRKRPIRGDWKAITMSPGRSLWWMIMAEWFADVCNILSVDE